MDKQKQMKPILFAIIGIFIAWLILGMVVKSYQDKRDYEIKNAPTPNIELKNIERPVNFEGKG